MKSIPGRFHLKSVADAVKQGIIEAGGQHVLEEAPDELHDFEGEGSGAVAVRFAIADEDRAVLDFQDPGVGDGDFEDVGGKAFYGLPRWSRRLGS